MKKILFATVLLLAGMAAMAEPVGQKRAKAVAENYVKFHFSTPYSFPGEVPIVCVSDVTQDVGVENVHIFNYMYCPGVYSSLLLSGFVVVSGDDAAAPILAFSTEGHLEKEDLNPAVLAHLQSYSRQIGAAMAKGGKPSEAVARKWQMLEDPQVLEYLMSKGDMYDDNIPQLLGNMIWGQGRPYNDKCPGGSVTGCVATAFGMIMNYWNWPEHGFGQHSYNGADNPAVYGNWTYGVQFADFEHTYYDWTHIEDYAVINSSDSVKEAISTLLYQIGVSLNMNYSPAGSGCWSLPEYAMFDTAWHLMELAPTIGADYRIPRHFGYKYSYAGMRDSIGNDSLWLAMLYNSLAEGKPIYYAGWAAENNEQGHSGTSGHGYILDGYFSDVTDSNYFHINWGWSGSANGFFKLDAMRPQGSDFTQWHGAVIGLEPDSSYTGYDYTYIPDIPSSNARIIGQQGRIVVQNAENEPVSVYDIMGRRMGYRSSTGGQEWTVGLRPGIYVVRVGHCAAQKVLVW